jgi:MFS family permease
MMNEIKQVNTRTLHIQFMAIFFVAYIAYAVSYTQMLPFLSDIGYSSSEKGLILSGAAVISIIGQFLFGYLCDKYKTVKKMFYIATIVFIAIVTWAYSITEIAFFFHLITLSLMGGFFRIVVGLLDSWTIERDPLLQKNFGIIRAFGSIGWIIGAPYTVWALSQGGYGSIGLNEGILSILTLLIGITMGDAQKVSHQAPIKMTDIKQLLKKKQYIILLIILTLINIVLYADAYTIVDKILALGGTATDISNKWVLQAFMELPLFFLGSLLYKRFSAKTLLMVGIFMFMVRFLLSALATSATQLVLISATQLVTFPFILLSSKQLIDSESPAHLKSTGQLLGLAMYSGLSALISPLMSGFLVDWIGTDPTLIFFGLLCLVPLGLSLWYRKMKNAY